MTILAVDEVMLREPRLLVPKMQPLGLVRGTNNPGVLLLPQRNVLCNSVNQATPLNASSRPTISISQYGVGFLFAEASKLYAAFSTTRSFNSAYTFLAVVNATGTDASYSNIFNASGSGTGLTQLRHSATTWYAYHNGSGGYVGVESPYSAGYQALVSAWNGASLRLTTLSGTVSANVSGWVSGYSISQINVGCDFGAGANVDNSYFEGQILYLEAIPGIAFSDAQALSFVRDPYQFLIPA